MKFIAKFLLTASLIPTFGTALANENPIPVIGIELDRYVGEWYEISRIPRSNDTQDNCRNTKAIYEALEDGTIGVENVCDIVLLGNDVKQRIYGIAKPLSEEEGIFELTLRPLSGILVGGNKYTRGFAVKGDYWVLELDEDYQFALIGNPARTNLFVIARTPTLSAETYQSLLDLAATKHGYGDLVDDLVLTPQN